ncbi:MAG: transcription-repair coupling factor [Peptoniphilaceae bacterium]|nr:transcription-repair coupling factor [Peptoniphilaceae bacterium]MDY6085954.1 transcription-repair coupling factor [Peptoniphilaceae bacterium]
MPILLDYAPPFQELSDALNAGRQSILLHGLVQESTGHFIASLFCREKRPVFVVVSNAKRARELTDALQGLIGEKAQMLLEEEVQYFKSDTTISPVSRQLLSIMERLFAGETPVVVTTLSALERPVTPPRLYQEGALHLTPETQIEIVTVLERLVKMHYQRTTSVEHPGEFSLRGDILDVYPPSAARPVRIEFFDTEIDRMRDFDVETQRSRDAVDSLWLTPAEVLSVGAEDQKAVLVGMRKDVKAYLKSQHSAEAKARAEEKFSRFLDDLETWESVPNVDLAAPYLSFDAKASLVDYLPEDGRIVLEDVDRLLEEAKERDANHAEERLSLLEQGELLAAHMKRPAASDVFAALSAYSCINVTQILKTQRSFKPDALIQMRTLEAERFHDRWDDLVSAIKMWKRQNYRILLFVGSARDSLVKRLFDAGISSHALDDDAVTAGEVEYDPGSVSLCSLSLPQGFRYPDSRLLVLTRSEIFGREKRRKTTYRPRKKSDLLHYEDLSIGDFVVHEIYGIGEYLGTETIEYDGLVRDFIKISYKGSDALYVPTDEMDKVTKYIGSGGAKPAISSLGGAEWKRAKQKAQKAVDEIAEDLVELYAKRSKIKGHAFGPDSPWQQDFEDAFPYEDTPSQTRATAEIKADMERPKPMDRLLCGDVGYGKTEVALRAAFKAIMDGKQVAFLAPTTILVQQHYQTMLKRFRQFPVRIEFLSRFKPPAKQKAVIKDLAAGAVDIIVGTHRLLSSSVHFKDLGLLIIDEEQRFGVKDKEKMKKLKENVDVLTLSATPIPRTLQLSLTGIRDLSLLEEPPEERYPTISYVLEEDWGVEREAIRRELDREGQVYVVHNRVHDLHAVYRKLQSLVPEARIIVAHGQMSTRELENVMETFVAGEADVLLATTIIETGMDIPNVNTLIVRHADRMGLAQLYQLKGRIGRGDRQSFAYFTYERNKVLSEISEKRLKAIRDFTDFGAGYKIAMRDLELRGAGNLLGESQSGHIASVGYELYVRLLEEAVQEAKGEKKPVKVDGINVDIRVSAYIPDDYIPQSSDKITMYRQIASIESEADYSTIVEELIDRYGDPPESVINLLDIVRVKRMATALGFSKIREAHGAVELQYADFSQFSVEMLKAISEGFDGPLEFDFQKTPMFKVADSPHKLQDVIRLLQLMIKLESDMEEKNEER